MFWSQEKHAVWKGLAAGAIGGAVASFAMNQFQAGASKLFEHPQQSPEKRDRAEQAQGWKEHREPHGHEEENATVKAAVAVSERVLRHQLAEEEKRPAGNAMHYAFGASSGALYGALAEESKIVRMGGGLAFGAVLWFLADEVAVPALGLSKRPAEYPPKVHAMALAAHLVYGLTTDPVRRALRDGLIARTGPRARLRW
jgi:hypothetical protein